MRSASTQCDEGFDDDDCIPETDDENADPTYDNPKYDLCFINCINIEFKCILEAVCKQIPRN